MVNVAVIQVKHICWSMFSVVILEQCLSQMLAQFEELSEFAIFMALTLLFEFVYIGFNLFHVLVGLQISILELLYLFVLFLFEF